MAIFVNLLFLALSALHIVGPYYEPSVKGPSKLLPIVVLIVKVLSESSSSLSWRLKRALALLFSLAGDFFLLFPDEDSFLCGLVAFLLSHVVYIYTFWRGFRTRPLLGIMVYALAGSLIASLWEQFPRDLQVPVAVYAAALATTAWRSLAAFSLSSPSNMLGSLGGPSFLVSDLALTMNQFVPKYRSMGADLIIMPTYYLAQLLLSMIREPTKSSGVSPAVAAAASAASAAASAATGHRVPPVESRKAQ